MKLRPDDFWRLSVEEWRWLNAAGAGDAPSRAEIEALVALYPDEQRGAFPPPLAGEVAAKRTEGVHGAERTPSVACGDTSPASGGGKRRAANPAKEVPHAR